MIDCHCHLLDIPQLSGGFFPSLSKVDITKIYCNSVSVSQWANLDLLAQKHPEVIPFYGIHPWNLRDITDHDLEILSHFLNKPKACCGEIGLDRLCKTDFLKQEKIFRNQLDLASKTNSFVAIHCVKAWGRMLEILAEYHGQISFMLHSFQGAREVMERVVAMGGMISFSDRVMAANQHKLQSVLMATPLENLLLETDFPFHKSRKGESPETYCQVLTNLYLFVSRLRQIPVTELTHRVERNGSICTY